MVHRKTVLAGKQSGDGGGLSIDAVEGCRGGGGQGGLSTDG